MSFTLDDRIEIFTDPRFNSENAARHFFASYGEAEVARKLAEMSGLQGEIEKVLKQKVRQNYGMFMNANEEVNKISGELSDLKRLIDSTTTMIQDVRQNRQADTARYKLASLVPHLSSIRALASKALHGDFDMLPEEMIAQLAAQSRRGILQRSKAGGSATAGVNLAPWVVQAPDDLAKLIVEQQYQHAVSLVLKLRGYVEGQNAGGGGHMDVGPGSAMGDVIRRVEDRASQLATILHKSLPQIPQSPLWGEEEQRKRMRWLIQLGHPALAADGFSRCQMDLMRRCVRAVEASGDPKRYTVDVSRTFYSMLLRSSLDFTSLFAAFRESPAIMRHLLTWSHNQMRAFIQTLAAQITLGAKEYSALCLMQLKPGFDFESSVEASIIHQHRDLITAVKAMFPDFPDMFSASCLEYFDWDVARTTDALLNENLPPQLAVLDPRMCASGAKGKVISKGPLTFTMECLDVAYAEATKLDVIGLQGASALGWLLLPELRHIISGVCEDVLRATAEQVRHDPWQGVTPRRILIKDPSHPSIQLQLLRGVGVQGAPGVLAGQSFDWFTSAVSHFLDEIWAFLKAQDDWDTYFHDAGRRSSDGGGSGGFGSPPRGSGSGSGGVGMSLDEQATYSREDVCQLEPHIVSCLLRCLLRLVLELEAVGASIAVSAGSAVGLFSPSIRLVSTIF